MKGRYSDTVPFADWPGTIYEIAGRQVKFIKARYGYAVWLLDRHGQAALPVSIGPQTLDLKKAKAGAERFLRKLDEKR